MTPQNLGQALWLAIKEVIHHDDVSSPTIIRSGGDIAARDPHSGDGRVVFEYNTQEGKAAVAWQGWDEAAEEQVAVGVEVFDPGTGIPVSALVNIREDRSKTGDGRWFVGAAGRNWHEEGHVSNVAADGAEQPAVAEWCEDVPVRGVIEQACQTSRRELNQIGGGRSLDEPSPWRREERTTRILKVCERASDSGRCDQVGGTSAVPVDLAAAAEYPWRITVVGISQSRAVRINRALNRGCGRPRRLEYDKALLL